MKGQNGEDGHPGARGSKGNRGLPGSDGQAGPAGDEVSDDKLMVNYGSLQLIRETPTNVMHTKREVQ